MAPPDLDPGPLPLLRPVRPDLADGRGLTGAPERGKPLVYIASTSTASAPLRWFPLEGASSFWIPPPFFLPALPGENLGLLGRTTAAFQRRGPSWRRRSRDGWRLWLWRLVGGGGGGALPSWRPVVWEVSWLARNPSAASARCPRGSLAGVWRPRVVARHGRRGDDVLSPTVAPLGRR